MGASSCITQTEDFIQFILNKKVLHLVSYSVNKKICVDEKDTKKFNKMLRFTGYKSFLDLPALNGLGKIDGTGCQRVHKIRETYPSLNEDCTGFKSALNENTGILVDSHYLTYAVRY